MSGQTPSPGLEADRSARHAAQTVFERPLVLEAGAGTGKTATLVARVLAWCLGAGWQRSAAALTDRPPSLDAPDANPQAMIAAHTLRRTVAITFTEAAAAEMASRAGAAFAQVAAGECPIGLDLAVASASMAPARAGFLFDAIDHLRATTIHGFCRRLLAEHPFDAGWSPAFRIDAAADEVAGLAEQVVAEALGDLYADPGDADALRLAADGVGPPELAAALTTLAAKGAPTELFEADPLAARARQALGERVGEASGRLLRLAERHLIAARRAANAARLIAFLRRIVLLTAPAPAAADPLDLRACVEGFLPKTLARHLEGWGRGRWNAGEAEALGQHRDAARTAAADLAPLLEHLRRLDPERLARGRRVIGPLYAQLRARMRSEGIVTFDDLIARTATLLADDPTLRRSLRRGMDQLLVDEFQDSDPRQCAIVRLLALDGPPTERPGLFVVGDPKQSIYGWRGADLSAYEGFVTAVEAAGGVRLPLVESFRSAPPILDEVTRLLEPVMKRRPGVQPAFVPLEPCRAKRNDPGFDQAPWAPVEHWVSWPDDPRAGKRSGRQATEVEARAVAADLVALDAAGVARRDIALLVRSTTDLEPYLAALRAAGVPYAVGRDRQYYRRREIIDAAAAVRAVLDPDDLLAFLTLLRAPAVGVPDAALLALWRNGVPELFARLDPADRQPIQALRSAISRAAEETPKDLPGLDLLADWPTALNHLADTIAFLRRRFAETSADRFLDELRRVMVLDLAEAARYLGHYRLAHLDRFFADLGADWETASGDRHQVLRRLRRRLAQAEHDDRPAEPAGLSDEHAVRMLTVHGAKGLQFRHVYLLQTHKGTTASRPAAVDLAHLGTEDARFAYCLFGATTLDWDVALARRRATEKAELVRTLYVAATRAAERLVIAGAWPADTVALERARTHADLLTHRSGPRPSIDQLCELLAAGTACLDHEGVRWVLPASISPVIGALSMPPARAAKGQSPRARLLLEHEQRQQARARAARPFRLGASRLAHPRRVSASIAAPEDDMAPATQADDAPEQDRARRIAVAAGTLVHWALETFDLAADDPAAELVRQRGRLPVVAARTAAAESSEQETVAACARAQTLLDRFGAGALFERFTDVAPRIIARELSVLLPPPEPTDDDTTLPVGFVAGAIDLVHRDPDGRWVIVDYKTDPVEGAELEARATRYNAQGRAYVEALTQALDLEQPPRFELWFLAADQLWE